jgi:hypothetical protein
MCGRLLWPLRWPCGDAIVTLLHGFQGVQGATDFKLIALRDDRGVQFAKTEAASYYTTSLDFDVYSRAAA